MAYLAPGITVIIPSIPPRRKLLDRAIESVNRQTLAAVDVIVAVDEAKAGAAVTRDRALFQVKTEWTAALDDDDEFLPFHLEHLLGTARETDADYVYSYPEMPVDGTVNPISCFNGLQWDRGSPHQTTVTTLYRTEIAHEILGYSGGYLDDGSPDALLNRVGEDYHFTLKFNEVGKIVHHPEATWRWYHHNEAGGNTSGLPSRW